MANREVTDAVQGEGPKVPPHSDASKCGKKSLGLQLTLAGGS